jgi:hypothetical protein
MTAQSAVEPMIEITQTGVVAQPGAVEKLREQFSATGCAELPGLLTRRLLGHLMRLVETSDFALKEEVGVFRQESSEARVFGRTLFAAPDDPARFSLLFLLNKPPLFRLVEAITGCPRLSNFLGRLHQTRAVPGQHIDWHGDLADNRVVGLNINLSAHDYSGGLFQLRGPGVRVPVQLGRTSAGNAFLFRIDEGWNHRLTPVESGVRTVCVGWFRTEPDRETFLRRWFPSRRPEV